MSIKTHFSHFNNKCIISSFKLYIGGISISLIGNWMQQMALSWQVYQISGSMISLAIVTALMQLPILFLTPYLSVIADRYDRRKVLITTQTLLSFTALCLAYWSYTQQLNIEHIYTLSFIIGLINAIDNPARQSFYPTLVEKKHLTQAVALMSGLINGTRLFSPAIAGYIVAQWGSYYCYSLNTLSYWAFILVLLCLPTKHVEVSTKTSLGESAKEGLLYVLHTPVVRTLLIALCIVSTTALPLVTFVPAIAAQVAPDSSIAVGYLLSAIGGGSLLAAVILASQKNIQKVERNFTLAFLALGVSVYLLTFPHSLITLLIIGALIGFFTISCVASINTMIQHIVPEQLRARVMGYVAICFTGISPLGALFIAQLEKAFQISQLLQVLALIIFVAALCYLYIRQHIDIEKNSYRSVKTL